MSLGDLWRSVQAWCCGVSTAGIAIQAMRAPPSTHGRARHLHLDSLSEVVVPQGVHHGRTANRRAAVSMIWASISALFTRIDTSP